MILTDLVMFFMLICIIFCVFSKKILTSLLFLGLFSMILSLGYFILQAPDVAIAEAALGSGLSVLVYMIVIKKTGGGV